MCVIIRLDKGQMIPVNMLETACYNNWHSWGLVVKVNNKLDITKSVPASGEIDPEEIDKIYNLLEKNKKYVRILHVRHNTAGATTLENAHPLDVLYDAKTKRQVVFAHNGTMQAYKSKKESANGVMVDDDSGPSDTKNYVDQVLTPLLSSTNFGNGAGDWQSEVMRKVLLKMWPDGDNKGILISNDQNDFLTGHWKIIKPFENDKDTHFLASNDSYFDKVIRGPEFSRREAKAAEERKRSKSNSVTNREGIVDLKEFQIDPGHGFYKLSTSVAEILYDWDLYDREHATALGYCSRTEIEELYDASREDMVTVFEWITGDYASLYNEFLEVTKKHEAASKRIATLVGDIKALKSKNDTPKKKVG